MVIVGSTDPVHQPSLTAGNRKHVIDFKRLQELRNLHGENVTVRTFVHVGKNSANSTKNNEGHVDYSSVPLLSLLNYRRGNFDLLTKCTDDFSNAVANTRIDEVSLLNRNIFVVLFTITHIVFY